jgi:hypothetical protein
LIKKVSIDIAQRQDFALRRRLWPVERDLARA